MITALVENIFESTGATIGVANAASSAPKERLWDRNRGLQMHTVSSGLLRVEWDGGSSAGGTQITRFSLLGHNYVSTAVILSRSTSAVSASSWTEIARFDARNADPFLSSAFTVSSETRAYRIEFTSNTGTSTSPNWLRIGELLLGREQQIGTDPSLRRGPETELGNVLAAESPSRYPFTYRRGAKLAVLDWTWRFMPSTDYNTLSSMFERSQESAKSFVMTDPRSVTRWVRFRTAELPRIPIVDKLDSAGIYEVRSEIIETP